MHFTQPANDFLSLNIIRDVLADAGCGVGSKVVHNIQCHCMLYIYIYNGVDAVRM